MFTMLHSYHVVTTQWDIVQVICNIRYNLFFAVVGGNCVIVFREQV